jgi:hypothetical protein
MIRENTYLRTKSSIPSLFKKFEAKEINNTAGTIQTEA